MSLILDIVVTGLPVFQLTPVVTGLPVFKLTPVVTGPPVFKLTPVFFLVKSQFLK